MCIVILDEEEFDNPHSYQPNKTINKMDEIRMRINITPTEQVEWFQLCADRGETSQDRIGKLIRSEILINKTKKEKQPQPGEQLAFSFGG